jgi:integrase
MATAKRRSRGSTPGVKVLLLRTPAGTPFHQARWRDPDSGRLVCRSLEALGVTSAEARRTWALAKSRELERRKDAIREGAQPRADLPLQQAIDDYLRTAEATLRRSTFVGYEATLKLFSEWAAAVGIKRTSEISGRSLALFRAHLIARPNGKSKKGGRRGERAETQQRCSSRTINKHMTGLHTALRSFVRLGATPALNRDVISDSMQRLPTPRPRPEYLSHEELRQLLEAALAHDAATFRMTRLEKDGRQVPGRTPRYEAIAPILTFLLLSGARRGEALQLEWIDVHLGARDERGAVVGEIVVRAESSKTKVERVIDLGVAPALQRLLLAIRAGSDGSASVFGLTRDLIVTAMRRLIRVFRAPDFTWQQLRVTCATTLVNAPGIYAGAATFREAKQLGHSVAVAEKHYIGVLRGIDPSARTVEAAMGIEDLVDRVIEQVVERGQRASGCVAEERSA